MRYLSCGPSRVSVGPVLNPWPSLGLGLLPLPKNWTSGACPGYGASGIRTPMSGIAPGPAALRDADADRHRTHTGIHPHIDRKLRVHPHAIRKFLHGRRARGTGSGPYTAPGRPVPNRSHRDAVSLAKPNQIQVKSAVARNRAALRCNVRTCIGAPRCGAQQLCAVWK